MPDANDEEQPAAAVAQPADQRADVAFVSDNGEDEEGGGGGGNEEKKAGDSEIPIAAATRFFEVRLRGFQKKFITPVLQ